MFSTDTICPRNRCFTSFCLLSSFYRPTSPAEELLLLTRHAAVSRLLLSRSLRGHLRQSSKTERHVSPFARPIKCYLFIFRLYPADPGEAFSTFPCFSTPSLTLFFPVLFWAFFPHSSFVLNEFAGGRELAGEQTNLSATLSLSLNLLLSLPPPFTARSLSKQHRCCCGNDGSLCLAPWTLLLHLHSRTSQIRQTHTRTHVRTRAHRSVVSVSSAFHHQSSVWPAVWGAEYETDKTNRLMSERQACRQKVLKLFLPTEHTNSSLSFLIKFPSSSRFFCLPRQGSFRKLASLFMMHYCQEINEIINIDLLKHSVKG